MIFELIWMNRLIHLLIFSIFNRANMFTVLQTFSENIYITRFLAMCLSNQGYYFEFHFPPQYLRNPLIATQTIYPSLHLNDTQRAPSQMPDSQSQISFLRPQLSDDRAVIPFNVKPGYERTYRILDNTSFYYLLKGANLINGVSQRRL